MCILGRGWGIDFLSSHFKRLFCDFAIDPLTIHLIYLFNASGLHYNLEIFLPKCKSLVIGSTKSKGIRVNQIEFMCIYVSLVSANLKNVTSTLRFCISVTPSYGFDTAQECPVILDSDIKFSKFCFSNELCLMFKRKCGPGCIMEQ